jgi:2-polyprenyl-3-methyl-5-hydroxy-6-metoxy-1,4-benzoquinol methylase
MKVRSDKKELLDGDNIPFDDIRLNMQELEKINTLLGGHSITLKGVRQLLNGQQNVHICEVGCGGGDNIKAIRKWCKQNQINARFTGIDIKDSCISYARENLGTDDNIELICSDYKIVSFIDKPDIIFSSLFCHHFSEDELTYMVNWKHEHSKTGFFINDLHRHPLAYHSIKWLTHLFSDSYLVKNDAPLSVERGFSREEWNLVFQNSRLDLNPRISWEWAFRWLITVKK